MTIKYNLGQFAIRGYFDKTETSIHNGVEIKEPILYRPDAIFRENNYVAHGGSYYNDIHLQYIKTWIRIGKDDSLCGAIGVLAPNATPTENYQPNTICCFSDSDEMKINNGESLSEAFERITDLLKKNLEDYHNALSDTLACYDIAKENQR